MNRAWEIIEKHGGSESEHLMGYKKMSSRKGMSGRKSGDTYEDGVYDGMCAAAEILDKYLKKMEED